MKKVFYPKIFIFLISSCTLLLDYNPIESLNYLISDDDVIYLTEELIYTVPNLFNPPEAGG